MPDQVRHDNQNYGTFLNYDTASDGRGCARFALLVWRALGEGKHKYQYEQGDTGCPFDQAQDTQPLRDVSV
jgi:hypothetical protein